LIHSFKCDHFYFEWAKTGDLRAEYMDTTSETLGNDLDKELEINPQFQV